MRRFLLFLFVSAVAANPDPCNNCSIPGPFLPGDDLECRSGSQSDDSYNPKFLRYSLGTECYLQMMDCPYYEMMNGGFCAPSAPPQQALRCTDGKFLQQGVSGTRGIAIERIRCNPGAMGTDFATIVSCDNCALPEELSKPDETSCGNAGSAGIQMTKTDNGTDCLLTLSGCESYNVIAGYDGTGICRTEENVVGVCVNGRFKLNGRDIYKARCGPSTPPPKEECENDIWMYNWMTDSLFKLGYNKNFEEAEAACIADGGQLASIHSQEENDFILTMAWMLNQNASVGPGLRLLFGAKIVWVGRSGSFQYVDGTPFDYDNWYLDLQVPTGTGECIALYTGHEFSVPEWGITNASIVPGTWRAVACSTAIEGYICKKPASPTPPKCTQCPPIAQNLTGNDDAALIVLYKNDTTTGCRYATFYCISTKPDTQVVVWSGDGIFRSVESPCNLLAMNIYKCNDEGVWIVNYEGDPYPQPAAAYCYHNGPCENATTPTTTTTTLAPATGCKSCPPFTQKPTEWADSTDATLTVSYDTSGECTKATIQCTTTTQGRRVNLYTNDGDMISSFCNDLTMPNAYTCNSDGQWVDFLMRTASQPRIECFQDVEC